MSAPNVGQLRQQFIAEVSRQSGVDPGVVDYWTTREGAYAPHGTGGLNFLNLRPYKGDPYAGVSPGGFEQFHDLPSAVQATVRRIKQPFLQQFLAPALGKGPDAQWDAIATSGWDAGHYGRTGLGNGSPAAPAASTPARDLVGGVNPSQLAQPDLAGARQQLLGFLMGNLQQHGHSDPAALLGELTQLKPLLQPQPVAAATTVQPTTPGTTPGTSAASMGASAKPDAAPGGTLAPVPDMIATRSGLQVDSAILPAVSRITQSFGVKVNSGYRSAEHNAAVGGAENSDHLRGDAVDFVGPPEAMQALYEWAQGKFPYVEPMSQAHDHVHISFLR